MKKVCRFCGVDEEHHHVPEYIEQPDNCLCDPLTWDESPIPPICNHYQGNKNRLQSRCGICNHDMACHEETIEDGFGGSWSKKCCMCGNNTMEIVRPGKVQCIICG